MIKFSLLCGQGHEFESWFRNGEMFEAQSESGILRCPYCDGTNIRKAIMAPALTGKREARASPPPAEAPQPSAGLPTNACLLDAPDVERREVIAAFRKFILETSEDVGPRFAAEARKIHDGITEGRIIHGIANFEDVHALIEDGINILPLPALPDELN